MSLQEKIDKSIARLKCFEPAEGYYLAFSGGKDSCVIKAIADMAGVKYDAHYHVTTIDPPDLIYYIRDKHPEVIWDRPKKPFLVEIQKKGFPTRQKRWCCEYLKERGGEGRIVITGVRWAESAKRKNRNAIELVIVKKENRMLFEDNDDGRRMFENCTMKGNKVVNPIIEWTDKDVWDFIRKYNIPYCNLYDEGWKRIGCIFCPMSTLSNKIANKKKYPKYYIEFQKAFILLYSKNKDRESYQRWESGEDMFNWWFYDKKYVPPNQMKLFDDDLQSQKKTV